MRVSRMNQSISQVFVVEAKLFPVPRVAPILLCLLWSTKYSLDDHKKTQFLALNVSLFKNFKNIITITAATWMCSNSQQRTGIFAKFTWHAEKKNKRVSQNTLRSKNMDSGKLLQHIEVSVRLRMPAFEEMLMLPFSIRQVELPHSDPSQDRHIQRRNSLTNLGCKMRKVYPLKRNKT